MNQYDSEDAHSDGGDGGEVGMAGSPSGSQATHQPHQNLIIKSEAEFLQAEADRREAKRAQLVGTAKWLETPTTTAQQLSYIRKLKDAVKSTDDVVDQPAKSGQGTKPAQAVARMQSGVYPDKDVELLCWRILRACQDVHLGIPIIERYHTARRKNEYETFDERIDAVIETCRKSKAFCKQLLDAEMVDRLVWAPEMELKMKNTNNKINGERNKQNLVGKRALKMGISTEDLAKIKAEEDDADEGADSDVEQEPPRKRKAASTTLGTRSSKRVRKAATIKPEYGSDTVSGDGASGGHTPGEDELPEPATSRSPQSGRKRKSGKSLPSAGHSYARKTVGGKHPGTYRPETPEHNDLSSEAQNMHSGSADFSSPQEHQFSDQTFVNGEESSPAQGDSNPFGEQDHALELLMENNFNDPEFGDVTKFSSPPQLTRTNSHGLRHEGTAGEYEEPCLAQGGSDRQREQNDIFEQLLEQHNNISGIGNTAQRSSSPQLMNPYDFPDHSLTDRQNVIGQNSYMMPDRFQMSTDQYDMGDSQITGFQNQPFDEMPADFKYDFGNSAADTHPQPENESAPDAAENSAQNDEQYDSSDEHKYKVMLCQMLGVSEDHAKTVSLYHLRVYTRAVDDEFSSDRWRLSQYPTLKLRGCLVQQPMSVLHIAECIPELLPIAQERGECTADGLYTQQYIKYRDEGLSEDPYWGQVLGSLPNPQGLFEGYTQHR